MSVGYREFEFDLPGALLDHLVRALDSLRTAPLDATGLAIVPEAQGVYQLFLDGRLVYIGKTDAEAGLLRRLSRHSCKTLHRRNLTPDQVTFKAIRIFVFTAIDLEAQLIRHYGGGTGLEWNGSGFGSNDPGRNRDFSAPGRFDQRFPIDIDRELDVDFRNVRTAAQVATRLKAALPYTFRYATVSRVLAHPELEETEVAITPEARTAREIIGSLVRQLPPGWQATALSALLILYKEQEDRYPQAMVLTRS